MKKSKRIAALALSLVLMLGALPLGLSPEAEAASPTDALADIAYYGDREKCALTYEMAQTYIEALEEFEGKDNVEVCLADFADDGYPIMFVLDWQSDSRFDLYIFDRDGNYRIRGYGNYRLYSARALNSENCSIVQYCEIDCWPAITTHHRNSSYFVDGETLFHTICTAGLSEAGVTYYRDSTFYVDRTYQMKESSELTHYYQEKRNYIEGYTIAEFSGDSDYFALPKSMLSETQTSLSAYSEAIAPAPYDGLLASIAYYGDRSKCIMSVDMTKAYAEVIDSLPPYNTITFTDDSTCQAELHAVLVDVADDGFPILVTAYTFSGNHGVKRCTDLRFWGYANGNAYDAEITDSWNYYLGKMDGKGLIFVAHEQDVNHVSKHLNWYYSVSKGRIQLEHTVSGYLAYASNYWGTSYDNPNLVNGWAPDGANYVIDGWDNVIDSTKLPENGWDEMACDLGWYLVTLDEKNVNDQCFPSTFVDLVAFDRPFVRQNDFGAVIRNVSEVPIAYITEIYYHHFNELYLDTSPATTMSAFFERYAFPFTDVSESTWYHQWVKDAYQMGLINGKTATTYCHKDNMSYAEAVKLAACMHQHWQEGRVTLKNGKDDWRSTYYDYCLEKGIIPATSEGEEPGYDELFAKASENIDRKTFVWLFSRTRPAKALREIHDIPDDSIPDVPVDDGIWDDGIYLFYRAGILNGSDAKGTFNPESSIQRSEVAAILVRMMDAHYRVDAPAELDR